MHWSFFLVVPAMAVTLTACSRQQAPTPAARTPAATVVAGSADVGGTVNLPRQVGEWRRPEAGKRVTAETIFDYMDGGGELYLAYRFDHLDVFEYTARDASLGTILVELYRLKTPDDAFGLLSNDWGGEAPEWDQGPAPTRSPLPMWRHRVLYGAGLLRLWAGDLYARVLASRETPDSRTAVLALGKALAESDAPQFAAQKPSNVPAMVLALPPNVGERGLRADRTTFFRSYLVLNSAYFLASQDILGLGLDVDAVTTEYRPTAAGERPIRLIRVRYPSGERARAAMGKFVRAYLPDSARKGESARGGAAQVEHGWVAWATSGQDLAIALDAADVRAAQAVVDATLGGRRN